MRISDWSSDVCSSDLLTCNCHLPSPSPSPPLMPRSRLPCSNTAASNAIDDSPDRLRVTTPPDAPVSSVPLMLRSTVSSSVLRSEEHTSELQSLMRISYAVFCLKKKNKQTIRHSIVTQ